MLHLRRPALAAWCPVHVTLRRARELPSFREQVLFALVKRAIADSGREDFRIVEYSVQADHVHLVIEADDAAALTRGMRSFSVRVAMRVNRRVRGRSRGRVWADRYHRRDLPTPTEVRWALVYVLANHLKHGHGGTVGLLDPFSSGGWFGGWMHVGWPPPTAAPATQSAQTWMMNEGWWRHGGGFIHLGERPAAARDVDVVALHKLGYATPA